METREKFIIAFRNMPATLRKLRKSKKSTSHKDGPSLIATVKDKGRRIKLCIHPVEHFGEEMIVGSSHAADNTANI